MAGGRGGYALRSVRRCYRVGQRAYLAKAWRDCDRADWMLWVAEMLGPDTEQRRKIYAKLARAFADLVNGATSADIFATASEKATMAGDAADDAATTVAAVWDATDPSRQDGLDVKMADAVRAAIPDPMED